MKKSTLDKMIELQLYHIGIGAEEQKIVKQLKNTTEKTVVDTKKHCVINFNAAHDVKCFSIYVNCLYSKYAKNGIFLLYDNQFLKVDEDEFSRVHDIFFYDTYRTGTCDYMHDKEKLISVCESAKKDFMNLATYKQAKDCKGNDVLNNNVF